MEDLRKIIGENLSKLRKERGLTQLDVANEFGYTDKTISKWEKGDVLPDVETLYNVAKFYGVDLNYLTSIEHSVKEEPKEIRKGVLINQILICSLLVSIVWIVATTIFVWIYSVNKQTIWQVFLAAMPVSCIVMAAFNRYWRNRNYLFVVWSIFIWTIILTFYFIFIDYNVWSLFILGIPSELALFLGTRIKGNPFSIYSNKNKNKERIKDDKNLNSNEETNSKDGVNEEEIKKGQHK